MAEWNKSYAQTPVIVSPGKRVQPDISPRVLELARQSGLAIQRSERNIVAESQGQPNNELIQLVNDIKINTDIDVSLKLIKLGFLPRFYNLVAGTNQQIIQPERARRGYIIMNPAEVSGFSSTITFLASAARAAGAYTSSSFNVSGVSTARAFLNVTGAGGTLTVDLQTQDPLTGNWATAQPDIFAGAAAVGTFYANLGDIGVDQNMRLLATVAGAAITFSLSGILKGGGIDPVGTTVYIGGSDVTAAIGYPILPSQREYFFLDENVSLFAISPFNPMVLKVFQLQ